MSADHSAYDDLDRQARIVHAASLEHVSARVQAQLAQRRRGALSTAPTMRRAAWPWATAAVAGVALVFAVQLRVPTVAPTVPAPAASAPVRVAAIDDLPIADALLSEDPDLYLWLASNDAQPYVE